LQAKTTKVTSNALSTPEALGPYGILILFVVAVLNIGVLVYTVVTAADLLQDVKGWWCRSKHTMHFFLTVLRFRQCHNSTVTDLIRGST
jgi:hypothetical protein